MGRDVSERQKSTPPNHIHAFTIIIDYIVVFQKRLPYVYDSYVDTVLHKIHSSDLYRLVQIIVHDSQKNYPLYR